MCLLLSILILLCRLSSRTERQGRQRRRQGRTTVLSPYTLLPRRTAPGIEPLTEFDSVSLTRPLLRLSIPSSSTPLLSHSQLTIVNPCSVLSSTLFTRSILLGRFRRSTPPLLIDPFTASNVSYRLGLTLVVSDSIVLSRCD